MELTTVQIREEGGEYRKAIPVHGGLPLGKGRLYSIAGLMLRDQSGNRHPIIQSRVLSRWNDGSIRWLSVGSSVSLEPHESQILSLLSEDSAPRGEAGCLNIEADQDSLLVKTPELQVRLAVDSPTWQVTVPGGSEINHSLLMNDASGAACLVRINSTWQSIENGPLYTRLHTTGVWTSPSDHRASVRFTLQLTIYSTNRLIKADVTVHNPQRAMHPGGLWDLGDEGSVFFESLGITVTHPEGATSWIRAEPGSEATTCSGQDTLRVYQDSSGGEHWDSRNHVDHNGVLIPRFRGYQLSRNDEIVSHSLRAAPVAGLESGCGSVFVAPDRFWQNFPSALGVNATGLQVDFFPPETKGSFELQGGERKNQSAWFHYGDSPDVLRQLQQPTLIRIAPEAYHCSGAFPWFARQHQSDSLDDLIARSLDQGCGFFAKREVIDEYGWRNFGDIFADHETLYQGQDEPPFLSHYNNQYDAIYGFARQFARTGDRRWFTLMDDLARHVRDIDIYHTEDDRAEYSGGLFWHTDHYLDAHTATHRTYSRHNTTSSIPGQTGGGPAAEHCYTTGLLYHYWMTGSEDSRAAVLELARWIRNAHEGVGGLLEQLLAIKKQDLPRLKKLLQQNQTGIHRYAFTRGTGNYLTALLDASLLEPEQDWLQHAERVIRATISPDDNIEQRRLLDAETGWSYLVLLSSLTRYLKIKLEQDAPDDHYHYALASLHHYWQWMASNERPFLEAPSELEFPNDTWVAQDIRKAMLMYQAAIFDPDNGNQYRAKADAWKDYVTTNLMQSPERDFARIQIILLQNYGPHQITGVLPREAVYKGTSSATMPGRARALTLVLKQVLYRLLFGVFTCRPTRERTWLKRRLET